MRMQIGFIPFFTNKEASYVLRFVNILDFLIPRKINILRLW